MTTGTVKSQGSELFFINPLVTDPTLVKMACPTGVSGLGGPASQIDTTCLSDTEDKTFVRGLGVPGQVTVPFNLIPRDISHQDLFDMKAAGNVIDWLLCLSESAEQPTVDTDFVYGKPASRTSIEFQGYISDVNLDVASDTIVKGTLLVQRSGPVVAQWYTPA